MKRHHLALLTIVTAAACGDMPPAPQMVGGGQSISANLIPADYIELPAGAYHKSCVYEVGNNDRFDRSGRVTRADGSTYQIPPCKYPTLNSRLRRGRPADIASYHGAGWREAIEGIAISGRTIRRITAQWTVPAAPVPSYGGNSPWYATFPGIENPDPGQSDPSVYILQPVLLYRHGYWYLTSVRCNDGSNCVQSPSIVVQPGDPILGVVDTPFGCDGLFCEFWVVTKNERTGEQTRLIVEHEFDNYTRIIGGAVEVGGLTSCSQYPPGGVSYSSIRVWDNYGQITPYWNTYFGDLSLGCNFDVRYTTGLTSTAYFQHGTQMTASISGPNQLPEGYSGTWTAYAGGPAATPPYTYQWAGFASGSGQSVSATPPSGGDYLVLYIWDSAGHFASTSMFVMACPDGQISC